MGKNRIPDDIFKRAIEKAHEIETSIFEKRFKDTDKHTFSEKYLERMQVLKMGKAEENDSKIANYSVKKKSTKVKILLIAAIVMLLGALTVAAEPVRDFITYIKENVFPDHTYISFEEMETEVDEESQKDSFIIRKPSYLPEGYTILEETKDGGKYEYTIRYENDGGEIITYQQIPLVYSDKIAEELSDLNKKDISWNDEQRYLFTDDNKYKVLLYEYGSYMYMVEGEAPLEELEKLIESKTIIMPEEMYPRKLKITPIEYEWIIENNSDADFGLYKYMQIFQNEESCNLVYEQKLIEEMDENGWSITADGKKAEDISICGEPAKVLTDWEEYHTIVYVRGEFVYMLGGYDDVDVLIECLEAVFHEEMEYDKKLFRPVGELTEINFEAEEDPVQSYELNMHADGGDVRIDSNQVESYNTDSQHEYIDEGETIGDCMFNSENAEYVSKIDREGYELTGWNVYEGTHVMDIGRDEEYDLEDDMEIFSLGEYMICIMENVELIAENISTDELKEIECTGKDFYVIANWEKVE